MKKFNIKPTLAADILSAVFSVETLAVVLYLLMLPRDPKNSLILGYSLQRLVLLAVPIIAWILGLFIWLRTRKLSQKLTQFWRTANTSRFSWPVRYGFLLAFLGCLIYANYPAGWLADAQRAYFERLFPLVVWLMVLSLEGFLLSLIFPFHPSNNLRKEFIQTTRLAVLAFSGLVIVWIVIRVSGWGLTPDPASWRQMGAPLLQWQWLLAVLIGIVWLACERHWHRLVDAGLWLDVVVVGLIYILTLWPWLSQPLQNSYFSPEARPPTAEVYPYSDALYYSLSAESTTAGYGLYNWTVTPRPFYLTVLSWIFAFSSGKYADVIDPPPFHSSFHREMGNRGGCRPT